MQNSFPLSLSLSAVQLWSSCPLPPAVISCCVSVNEAACRFELLLKLQQFIFDTFLLVYVCVCVCLIYLETACGTPTDTSPYRVSF